MSAFQRVREFHPQFSDVSDAKMEGQTFSLSDAQLSVAREYGYASWPRLKSIVAKQHGLEPELIHNDRIDDGRFKQALDFLDTGDAARLTAHLEANPSLVHKNIHFEGDNYFTNPTLLEFVAENPIRRGRLPTNIVEITKIILEAGARENQKSLDETVGLLASGRICREQGFQQPLLRLLCEYGADSNAGLHSALGHGEFDAARILIACGATLDLPSSAALNQPADVERLLPRAAEDQMQLGLALAALHGCSGIVAMLLRAGADPNRYNPPGGHSHCTPLHSAVYAGHLETVKTLVTGGARLDIGDIHHGATALAWAEHAGHKEIVGYLNNMREN